jgi:hypothetical protein
VWGCGEGEEDWEDIWEGETCLARGVYQLCGEKGMGHKIKRMCGERERGG